MGSGPIQHPIAISVFGAHSLSPRSDATQKPKRKKKTRSSPLSSSDLRPIVISSPLRRQTPTAARRGDHRRLRLPLICTPSPAAALLSSLFADGRLQPSSPPLFADELRRQPQARLPLSFLIFGLLLPPRNPRPTPPLLSDFRCPSPPPANSISSVLPEPPSTQPPHFSSFLKTCAQPYSSLISGASTSTPHHLDLLHSLPPPL